MIPSEMTILLAWTFLLGFRTVSILYSRAPGETTSVGWYLDLSTTFSCHIINLLLATKATSTGQYGPLRCCILVGQVHLIESNQNTGCPCLIKAADESFQAHNIKLRGRDPGVENPLK